MGVGVECTPKYRYDTKNGFHIVPIACIDIIFDDSGQFDRHDTAPSQALNGWDSVAGDHGEFGDFILSVRLAYSNRQND